MSADAQPPVVSRRAFLAAGAAVVAGGLVACGDDSPRALPADADADVTDAATLLDADTDVATDVTEATTDADATVPERADPATATRDDARFPFPVQAGDPLPDGVILWTRVNPAPAALELLVIRPDGAPAEAGDRETTPGDLALQVSATPADGGFVHVDARGLAPATRYHYWFRDGAARSAVGSFRTAPAPGALPVVVLGATSCARYAFRPFEVLSVAARDALDAFLLLGDTVYADDSHDLATYRARWAESYGVAGYRDVLPSVACVATWDDHEVDDNWDPETFDPDRLAAARAAFFEHVAVRRDPDHPERIWRRLSFGDTADVFVLDSRSERLPSTRETANATYLSPAQLDWLRAGLSASTAVFKLIMSSVPITEMPPLLLGRRNRWSGYAAQRATILDHAASVPGVFWLAGDLHFGAICRVDPPGEPHFDQVEILAGPVAHVGAAAVVELSGDPAQFPWIGDARNYARLTLDPTATPPTLTVAHVGADGELLHSETLTA